MAEVGLPTAWVIMKVHPQMRFVGILEVDPETVRADMERAIAEVEADDSTKGQEWTSWGRQKPPAVVQCQNLVIEIKQTDDEREEFGGGRWVIFNGPGMECQPQTYNAWQREIQKLQLAGYSWRLAPCQGRADACQTLGRKTKGAERDYDHGAESMAEMLARVAVGLESQRPDISVRPRQD